MGKSDEKQTKKKAHKAKATDGEIKHKIKPSFDAATFEATDNEGTRHSQWRDLFRQSCEYKAQSGDCRVPNRYSVNPKLGIWVSMQRTRHRKNTEEKSTSMAAERIRALNGIGFDWGTSKSDLASIWSVRLEQLREFKVQFGHCIVPFSYSAKSKLGVWVSTQRYQCRLYKEGKPSHIRVERIRELESIGFKWEQINLPWNEQFEQLREFKAQFGHCLVPQQYSANPKLGWWVLTQRYNYMWYQEGTPSSITAERIRELENVGFDWGTSKADLASIWNVRFQQLREFKVQFGHCVVPLKYSASPKLGRWVLTQRYHCRLYQEGKPNHMTVERIRELESIEFKWEQMNFTWNEQFEQLREFKVQFGHCVVPIKYSASPKLRKWVSTQRYNCRLYQEGKPSAMTAERIRELESVEFKWKRNSVSRSE